MSRIRARHTEPERVLRSLLWRAGHRYRLHHATPAGRPDLAFPRAKVAVFIDGCFWHGCPQHYVRPRSSGEFWAAKLEANVRRDCAQTRRLEELGWSVCRIWEHEVFENPKRVGNRVLGALIGRIGRPRTEWRVVRVVPVGASDRETWELRDLREGCEPRIEARIRSTRKWKRSPEASIAVRSTCREA
jgi:DNA mismatch endonuclease (patch repair protein)